jgi:hypothetical protein
VNLIELKGVHNLIAEIIKDEDESNLIGLLVDNNIFMNDRESHLMTKLKISLKLGARDKLGKALVEAG